MPRDETEFRDFVRQRWAHLVRYAYLLTGDPMHAEDLVQAAGVDPDGADRRADRDLVWAQLALLPPRMRAVVVLRVWEGIRFAPHRQEKCPNSPETALRCHFSMRCGASTPLPGRLTALPCPGGRTAGTADRRG
jgi:hypothetical protein